MKNTQRRRRHSDLTLSRLRSAVSNGSAVLANVDHRSAWMRRLRDLVSDHANDLGGPEALSTAEKALVRRAAMLTLQTELMESRWAEANGEASPRQIETYQRTANTLRRLLESLGTQRRPKDITPPAPSPDLRAAIRRAREAHPVV